jgi:DNA polymerase-1
VYDGRTFKLDRFEAYLVRNNIEWPRQDSGQLDLTDNAFGDVCKSQPQLSDLKYIRRCLSQMRLNSIEVGADGNNRCLLSPFRARTGRNQPSNAKFIFGASSWLRHVIQPKPGHALAALDWVQQEVGIAAALSGDANLKEAYSTGDCYLAFAKQAKAVPPDATKKTHHEARSMFKACVLGVQYGLGEEKLASNINQSTFVARELLRLHREVYSKFWAWAENRVNRTILEGSQATVFGWTHHIPEGIVPNKHSLLGTGANARAIQNFFMQANGAEILRLACILATEASIRICAPVHDAVVITAPLDQIDEVAARMAGFMVKASQVVLDGFELQTDLNIFRYPEHYACEKGAKFWETVKSRDCWRDWNERQRRVARRRNCLQ